MGRAVTMIQPSLFGAEETPVPPPPDQNRNVDMEALSQLAILYTATAAGNNSGIRFMLSIDDAMRWCESPISQGVLHGTPWAYFFTRVSSYINCYWLNEQPIIDLAHALDDGRWDERISSVGCKKIAVWEFRKHLEPLGVQVINEPLAPPKKSSARPKTGALDLMDMEMAA